MIHDKDGSLGGGPNSYVLINDGVNDSIAADAEACEIKPTWNAAVCKGDVGRLTIGGPAVADSAALVARSGEACCRSRRGRGGPGAAARSWRTWWRLGAPAGPPQPPVILSRNGKDYNRDRAPTYEPVPRSR